MKKNVLETEEGQALYNAFKQVKLIQEGKLETRPIEELLRGCLKTSGSSSR